MFLCCYHNRKYNCCRVSFSWIVYFVFRLKERKNWKYKSTFLVFQDWSSCWKGLLLILFGSGSFQQCNDYPNLCLADGESTLNKTKIADVSSVYFNRWNPQAYNKSNICVNSQGNIYTFTLPAVQNSFEKAEHNLVRKLNSYFFYFFLFGEGNWPFIF